MRKFYEEPKMEIVEFDANDVITTSGFGGDGGDWGDGDGGDGGFGGDAGDW